MFRSPIKVFEHEKGILANCEKQNWNAGAAEKFVSGDKGFEDFGDLTIWLWLNIWLAAVEKEGLKDKVALEISRLKCQMVLIPAAEVLMKLKRGGEGVGIELSRAFGREN